MNFKNKYIPTIIVLIVMVIMATAEGFINIFGNTIKSEFLLNDTRYSLMFTLGSIAYLISNYIGGILCNKIGQKILLIAGLFGAILGNIILATSVNFNMFILGFVLIQFFLGMMAISINTIIPLIWITGQAIIMNLTHFAYGAGLSVTQKISGILLSNNITWRKIYVISAMITLLIAFIVIITKFPINKESDIEEKISLKQVLSNKICWLFIIGIGSYIFAEQATGRWLPIYFKNSNLSLNDNHISSIISLFFLLLTIGRLIGGFIIEKIGIIKGVIIFSFIGGLLFFTGLILKENGLYLIPISGFFFSIIFPTTVIIIGKIFKVNSSYIVGSIISFAGIVNTLINLTTGILSDVIGISLGIFIIPLCLLTTFISILLVNLDTKDKDIKTS
ncbi:MFS transporter [Clostridium sp. CTA-7]